MIQVPNPSGSATEKWQPTRWGMDPRTERLRQLLLREGVEEGLAVGFAMAMGEWTTQRAFTKREVLEEFSRWANTHTHEFVAPSDPDPYELGTQTSDGANPIVTLAGVCFIKVTGDAVLTSLSLRSYAPLGWTGVDPRRFVVTDAFLTDYLTASDYSSEDWAGSQSSNREWFNLPFPPIEVNSGDVIGIGWEGQNTSVEVRPCSNNNNPMVFSGSVESPLVSEAYSQTIVGLFTGDSSPQLVNNPEVVDTGAEHYAFQLYGYTP